MRVVCLTINKTNEEFFAVEMLRRNDVNVVDKIVFIFINSECNYMNVMNCWLVGPFFRQSVGLSSFSYTSMLLSEPTCAS